MRVDRSRRRKSASRRRERHDASIRQMTCAEITASARTPHCHEWLAGDDGSTLTPAMLRYQSCNFKRNRSHRLWRKHARGPGGPRAPRPPDAWSPSGWGRCPPRSLQGQALRRRISLFSRSIGLLDQSFCQCDTGKAVKARMSGTASASIWAAWAKRSYSWVITRSAWARTSSGESCL